MSTTYLAFMAGMVCGLSLGGAAVLLAFWAVVEKFAIKEETRETQF